MNHLRFMHAVSDGRRVVLRGYRRDAALLASLWAAKLGCLLAVDNPSALARAVRYSLRPRSRVRQHPLAASIVAICREFVALTFPLNTAQAVLPAEALRRLEQDTRFPAEVREALALELRSHVHGPRPCSDAAEASQVHLRARLRAAARSRNAAG